MAPLAVALTLLLVLTCGAMIDLAAATVAKQAQENHLAVARDRLASPDSAMLVKSAPETARQVADVLAGGLRADGWDGEIVVWVQEANPSQVPRERRAIAWCVQISEDVPTTAARGVGIESFHVATEAAGSLMPYSGPASWRPEPETSNRRLAWAPGENEPSEIGQAAPGECPPALLSALDDAVKRARGE